MLMKLFKKSNEKKKKPLSDKAKEERKQKIKKIIKRVLDILVYGFAIFMIFGLLLGSCNTRAKVVSAYYHSDDGYNNFNSVIVDNTYTNLNYYYDYNYSNTFPSWNTFFVFLPSYDSSAQVTLENNLIVDNVTYRYLVVQHINTTSNPNTYLLRLQSTNYQNVTIATISTSSITINRSDLLTSLFNGNYRVYVENHNDNNDNFFRFLTWYFGDLGYNRITYDSPVIPQSFTYLFVNSDNTTSLIENGLFFKNDLFPEIEGTSQNAEALTTIIPVFQGSFRVDGVYYNQITYHFSSVFGNVERGSGAWYTRAFVMPGSLQSIRSSDEFYRGYWYLDSIHYVGNGIDTLVWQGYSEDVTNIGEGEVRIWTYFKDANWVGDSYWSTSPYRTLYIYYAFDGVPSTIRYPFADYFPQLSLFNFSGFLNYIGEAYPHVIGYVPDDNTPAFTNVFEWLRVALRGVMPIFSYTLIPGITIGTLVMVPLVMSIVLFLIKLFKR